MDLLFLSHEQILLKLHEYMEFLGQVLLQIGMQNANYSRIMTAVLLGKD